jgi:hypothetical protein
MYLVCVFSGVLTDESFICLLNSLMSLDLPSTPLFKDSQGGNIIPQVCGSYVSAIIMSMSDIATS